MGAGRSAQGKYSGNPSQEKKMGSQEESISVIATGGKAGLANSDSAATVIGGTGNSEIAGAEVPVTVLRRRLSLFFYTGASSISPCLAITPRKVCQRTGLTTNPSHPSFSRAVSMWSGLRLPVTITITERFAS